MKEVVKPSVVLFDWDNTLVNTWPVIHRALHDTFTQWGMEPWTLQMVRDRVAKSMRDSFPELFGENWEEAGKLYQQNYRKYNLAMLEELPAAEQMLEFLRDKGIPLGVVSNKKSENLNSEMDHIGWRHYFGGIVGSDDAPTDKPHREPVELALSHLGIPLDESVWFVGDSAIDLECAKNCGMFSILYGDVKTDGGTYKGFPYDKHVKNHEELIDLISLLR